MSELNFDSLLMVRAPAYSHENFNEEYLQKVLATDFFRAALFFASRSFYDALSKKSFDYNQLNPQLRFTLWKYLNRMCYRALPYGLFSSYAALSYKTGEGLVFTGGGRLKIYPDFKQAADLIRGYNAANFNTVKYFSNNSLYRIGRQCRFISQDYSAESKFSIIELTLTGGLNELLCFMENGRTKKDFVNFLLDGYDDLQMIDAYFESLLEAQVLVSELTPNITGKPYVDRSIELLAAEGITCLALQSHLISVADQYQTLPVLNEYLAQELVQHSLNPAYTRYERIVSGGMSSDLSKCIPDLVRHMDKLSADQDIDHMKVFKAAFIKRYDQQEVSLMEVLDPGCGIGYENLASAYEKPGENFIADVRINSSLSSKIAWGDIEKMIFKKWKDLAQNNTSKINITAEDLKDLPESKHQLPPGLFVLFKVIDDQVWLDNIGGVSGVELNARFGGTVEFPDAMIQDICAKEMALNNEFIFAEIAFSPNDKASNINQRGDFYPYEIPVLTHSCKQENKVIKLNDLYISVQEDTIFLRSARLNKYIIPRLSSAYNYQRCTISVFRFLCDLQYQGTKSNLSFSLRTLFPGMDYYPRLEMDGVVISPATWMLNEEQIKEITQLGVAFINELNLPGLFSLQEGDHFLVFNKEKEEDLAVFIQCIKNQRKVILTEFVLADKPLLTNSDGDCFNSQLVACVTRQSKSYTLPKGVIHKKNQSVKRSFLPGEEWLYLKLYSHSSVTDEILKTVVLSVVKKYKQGNAEFKWFFIRYQDDGAHLRLRFFTNGMSSSLLLAELIKKLQPFVKCGKVASAVIDSYQRELEKYSPALIKEVESFFYADSEYVLAVFVKHHMDISFKMSFAVNSSLLLIQTFITDKNQCLDFLHAVQQNICAEFNRSKDVVHKLDVRYRKFQKELINQHLSNTLRQQDKNYRKALSDIVQKTERWSSAERYNLLINLVHMHINRIFNLHSREYEYVIYHFMKKHQAFLNHTSNGSF